MHDPSEVVWSPNKHVHAEKKARCPAAAAWKERKDKGAGTFCVLNIYLHEFLKSRTFH